MTYWFHTANLMLYFLVRRSTSQWLEVWDIVTMDYYVKAIGLGVYYFSLGLDDMTFITIPVDRSMRTSIVNKQASDIP